MKRVMLTAAIMIWGAGWALGADPEGAPPAGKKSKPAPTKPAPAKEEAAPKPAEPEDPPADEEAVPEAAEAEVSPDEEAIRKAVDSYVTAYNKGDAKALAEMWSKAAIYTHPVSGEQIAGREAIAEYFAGIFTESKEAKLQVVSESIQFVSPSVALERGTATVVLPEQTPDVGSYTAVYVKQDGNWLLDRITEEEVLAPPSQYENLKELEFLIGNWIDEDEDSRIESNYTWTKNQTFITNFFTVAVQDRVEISGLQIIGWDPAAKRIRSWVFDSDGGFGQGVWSQKDKSWSVHTTGTLADGRKASAINVITRLDDDTYTWQSVNRAVGDEILPNVDEVIVARQPAAE